MISREFYNKSNTRKDFFGKTRLHFANKDRYTVLTSFSYTLTFGENMYTLAEKIFGEGNEYLWPIIADINVLRDPTDWNESDEVLLPEIILNETINKTFKVPVNAVTPATQV